MADARNLYSSFSLMANINDPLKPGMWQMTPKRVINTKILH